MKAAIAIVIFTPSHRCETETHSKWNEAMSHTQQQCSHVGTPQAALG